MGYRLGGVSVQRKSVSGSTTCTPTTPNDCPACFPPITMTCCSDGLTTLPARVYGTFNVACFGWTGLVVPLTYDSTHFYNFDNVSSVGRVWIGSIPAPTGGVPSTNWQVLFRIICEKNTTPKRYYYVGDFVVPGGADKPGVGIIDRANYPAYITCSISRPLSTSLPVDLYFSSNASRAWAPNCASVPLTTFTQVGTFQLSE